MTKWQKITINKNLIQKQTEKSALIKLPKTDLFFWHNLKCLRLSTTNKNCLHLFFTESFIFKCFKSEKIDGAYKNVKEVEYTADEFKNFFNQ
jgi:hypothetical protein